MITRLVERLLETPLVYALWQAPFAARKFAPVERALALRPVVRVLDVGCGPGTNASRFPDADYVGIDVNEDYLRRARARYPGSFIGADLEHADLSALGVFDTILVNSVLHHLSDDTVNRVLTQLQQRLAPHGHIHVLELVLPPTLSPSWVMAKLDRGNFPRPIDHWERILAAHFSAETFAPYSLGRLWAMVYFQGGPKT